MNQVEAYIIEIFWVLFQKDQGFTFFVKYEIKFKFHTMETFCRI